MRRLFIAILVGTAYFFSITSVWISCRFFEYQNSDGTVSAIGLFALSYRHEVCHHYRDIHEDWRAIINFNSTTRTSQAMGVLATLFGSVAVLFTIFGSCLLSFLSVDKILYRRTLAGSLLMAGMCQSLTFLFLVQAKEADCGDPENDCKLGFGGIASLVATILYLVAGAGVTVLALQPPKDNRGTTFLVRLGNKLMNKMGITWRANPLEHLRWKQDLPLLVFSLILFLCSLTVILDCRFWTVNFSNDTRQYSEGLIYYHYYPDDSCRAFEKGGYESFEATTIAGVAFGVTAAVLGGLIMLLLWGMILLVNYPLGFYKALPVLGFLAAAFQSFTFLSNLERNELLCADHIPDQTCQWGPDAYLAFVTVALYLLFVPALWWYSRNPNICLPITEGTQPSLIEQEAPLVDGAEKGEMMPPEVAPREALLDRPNEEVAKDQ